MKKINSIKIIYLLSALLFCISLQSTATTQSKIKNALAEQVEQNNQNAHNAFDLRLTRKKNSDNAKQNDNPGTFDTSFGSNGSAVAQIGTNSQARAVAIQQDNKIVVAGINQNQAVLVRYLYHYNRGYLDSNFGTYGVVIAHLGGISFFNALAIQKDKKIVAAGQSDNKFAIARYHENSTLDTSFGGTGVIKTVIDGEITAMAIQEDHKIVVAGYNRFGNNSDILDTQIMLIRYNENGSLDTTFGTLGTVTTPFNGKQSHVNGITVGKDHTITIVGGLKTTETITQTIAIRYHEDGTLNTIFDPSHTALRSNFVAHDVVVQKDNKTIMVGSSISPFNKNVFTIMRFNKNNSLDTSFGDNGVITITPTNYIGDNAYATKVALDEDEKIIVMGYTIAANNNNYFSLVRFNPNGTLDKTFGRQGTEYTSIRSGVSPNKNRTPAVGAIQNDTKKLALTGNYSASNPTTSNQFAVALYHK